VQAIAAEEEAMIVGRRWPVLRRMPGWLIILAALLTASVIAERVPAATVAPSADQLERLPRTSRLMSGRGVAFALTFDQIVSHSTSELTLVTPTGSVRRIPIRLVAQPNTLYASIGGLEPGDYRLQWDAQAGDGTRLRGNLPFSVGQGVSSRQF
jgi:methionine-rich copper-binding protein CopC